MLNEKLFEVFGEESRLFFKKLSSALSDSELSVCYAINCGTMQSGKLVAPERIAVQTDDKMIIRHVDQNCINISMDLGVDEDECIVIANRYEPYLVERDGIKLWV